MNSIIKDMYALGDTYQKVADTLTSLGIKGRRNQPDSCPIYNYLQRQGHKEVMFVYPDKVALEDGYHHFTTSAVFAFICRFDEKQFPQLEDNS
jgi:hypothetical protein